MMIVVLLETCCIVWGFLGFVIEDMHNYVSVVNIYEKIYKTIIKVWK